MHRTGRTSSNATVSVPKSHSDNGNRGRSQSMTHSLSSGAPLSPGHILQLQQTVGNRVVSQLLQEVQRAQHRPPAHAPIAQRKIHLTSPGIDHTKESAFTLLQGTFPAKADLLKWVLKMVDEKNETFDDQSKLESFLQPLHLIEFKIDGDLVLLNNTLTLHKEKFYEYMKDDALIAKIVHSSKDADTDPKNVGSEHELVKSGGERLRFEHHLQTEVDDFINKYVTTGDKAKVEDFIKPTNPNFLQDRMRLYDLANDKLKDAEKTRAANYAAKYGDSARLFANHYTFYASYTKGKNINESVVYGAYTTKSSGLGDESKGTIGAGAATTAQEAIDNVRAVGDTLKFESIEAGISHLQKHPMQDPTSDTLSQYIKWARLTIKNGDADATRNQFDGGWSVGFHYGGKNGHECIVKLQEDGTAFLSTFMPQSSTVKEQPEDFHFNSKSPAGVAGPNKIKTQVESLRKYVKEQLNGNASPAKTGVPGMPDTDHGAKFGYGSAGKSLSISQMQAEDHLDLTDPDNPVIFLDSRINKEFGPRLTYMIKRFEDANPLQTDKIDMLLKWLDTALQGTEHLQLLINGYINQELGLGSGNVNRGTNFASFKGFIKTQIDNAAKEIDDALTDIKNGVGDASDHEKKKNEAMRRGEKLLKFFTLIQTKILKDEHDAKPAVGAPKMKVSPNLIHHLITPEGSSLADFRTNGVKGGHDEANLQMFLKLNPKYHFIEARKITGQLNTTLRMYRQFIWKDPVANPPAISDAGARPSLVDLKAGQWEEAGVKKSTAENILGWLEQGMEAANAWSEFDPKGPTSQLIGRRLYENAPGDPAKDTKDVEFGGRVEFNAKLNEWVVTQLVPHVDWLKTL